MDAIAKFIGYIVLVLIGIGIWKGCSEERAGKAADTALASLPSAPPPAPEPPRPTPVKFMDEDVFVATEDAAVIHFFVKYRVKVRVLVTIDNAVPLAVVTTSGTITKNDYVVAAAVKGVSDVFSVFSDEARKNNTDFFGDNLSKQAAYKRFESPWVYLEAGNYSIILDNTGTFTPTRGDTPANVKFYFLASE